MSDQNKYENIGKQVRVCKEQGRNLAEYQENLKCSCPHTKKGGEPALVKKGNSGTMYTCAICEKNNINLSRDALNIEKLKEHIEPIDQALDIIKLNLKLDNDDDKKQLKKIAKTQFFLRFMFIPLIESILKRDKKGKKNKTNQESSWGKSRAI